MESLCPLPLRLLCLPTPRPPCPVEAMSPSRAPHPRSLATFPSEASAKRNRTTHRRPIKTIGLFANNKRAASPIQAALEAKLKAKFPTLKISHYVFLGGNREVAGTQYESGYADWLKGVDAVVSAVGD